MEAKVKPTIVSFKSFLKKTRKIYKNLLFYYGKRDISIHHARIRMGCSLLNGHLNKMLHVTESLQCECGFHVESPRHYYMECPRYAGSRIKMIDNINLLTDCNIDRL